MTDEPRVDAPSPNDSKASASFSLLLTTWDDGEAAMIRQILESDGIPCQVVSDVPHSVLPLSVDGLGEVRILVPSSRLDQARQLLADYQRSGQQPAQDESPDSGADE